jgi:hypothetical protein
MNTTTLPLPTIVAIASLPSRVQDLMNLKGQIATLRTVRTMKVLKGQTEVLKESTFQCRIGVKYDNIAAVKEKRADGTLPEENAGLPWGSWLVFPYVIAHKGNHYFRCTTIQSTFIPRVCFYQGGKEITKAQAQVACAASEFYEKDNDVFTIKVESIVEINGKVVG